MKIERMFALLLYLLGHGRVSKSSLANYFEVSTKTIQRDIESLVMVGIPIHSYLGMNGGYEIDSTYKMKNQIASANDFQSIIIALKALNSAVPSPLSEDTLTKIQSLHHLEETYLSLDFNVLKEKEGVMNNYHFIEEAILNQHVISFIYQNAKQEESKKVVDAIGLIYKWYTWYLVGYDRQKEGYRYYKLLRMNELHIENGFTKEHLTLDEIINRYLSIDIRPYYDILLLCKVGTNLDMMECLNGKVQGIYSNGDYLYKLHLPVDEMNWKGALILLGNQIEILQPLELKKDLIQVSQNFITNNQ